MARAKQTSKHKRPKMALPVWGAAGMSLAMAGGASAGVAPTAKAPSQRTALPSVVTLGEEELADISLSTFFVFDRESTAASRLGEQVAQRGCRGCRGCAVGRCGGRCGGVGRCAVRRCGGGCGVGCAGCAGCSCSCCLSWGSCQLC
jgi:hypothetical protein